ncbi:MAG: hypothetical protein ACOH2K_16810 [Burkholderiaceae bacterium]
MDGWRQMNQSVGARRMHLQIYFAPVMAYIPGSVFIDVAINLCGKCHAYLHTPVFLFHPAALPVLAGPLDAIQSHQ